MCPPTPGHKLQQSNPLNLPPPPTPPGYHRLPSRRGRGADRQRATLGAPAPANKGCPGFYEIIQKWDFAFFIHTHPQEAGRLARGDCTLKPKSLKPRTGSQQTSPSPPRAAHPPPRSHAAKHQGGVSKRPRAPARYGGTYPRAGLAEQQLAVAPGLQVEEGAWAGGCSVPPAALHPSAEVQQATVFLMSFNGDRVERRQRVPG